jgi:glycosyltransferase involved in cell wall biosynthesis
MNRILMITASAGFGGGPQHVHDLAAGLRGDVLVDIACPCQEPFYQRFRDVIDGELLEIPERRFTFTDTLRIQAFARRRGSDLVHSHGKGAGVYGRVLSILSGLPLVHTPHGIHVDQYGQRMRLVYLGYERLLGGVDARTIFVSPSEMARARGLCIGRPTRSVVICNGVPAPGPAEWLSGARAHVRSMQGLSESDIVVATLSRFDFAKNMQEMVRIADRERKLRFWFIGDGAEYQDVKTAVNDLRMDHVWLSGFVNNPLDYLAAADIYLSTSRWEGLPLALLQAMSLGKPVVASNVTGNKDAVAHDESGYLYPLGQHAAAAEYLNKLASDSNTRLIMGDAGQRRQREFFSVKNMVRKTLELYEDVLSN